MQSMFITEMERNEKEMEVQSFSLITSLYFHAFK